LVGVYPKEKKEIVARIAFPSVLLDNLYLAGYNIFMKYIIESTKQFDKWFGKLKGQISQSKSVGSS